MSAVLAQVPSSAGGPYVIAAYVVVLVLVVVYLAVMAQRLRRVERHADRIQAMLDDRAAAGPQDAPESEPAGSVR